MRELKPEWQGTMQHEHASDLSRFLVHLTCSEEDFISILKTGVIEARTAFGAGSTLYELRSQHRSVCLTETPLHELGRMTAKRPWGIVFDKERLRSKFFAQPVWYVTDPSPQREAVRSAMQAAVSDLEAPIWKLTPFIEYVRSRQSKFPNDWRWEREWRVPGDLRFDLADVQLVVTDDAGAPAFLEEIPIGLPWRSHGSSETQWIGGISEGWDADIASMLARFRETYLTPGEGGFTLDAEDGTWYGLVELVATEDAMDDVFGGLTGELSDALRAVLDGTSDRWCRTYDLENVGDD